MPSLLANGSNVKFGDDPLIYKGDAASSGNGVDSNQGFSGDVQEREITGMFSFFDPVTLTIVSVCSASAALICVVALVWYWFRRRHTKLYSISFDNSDGSKSTKSAPCSRNASPKLKKLQSCPGALSASADTQESQGQVVIPKVAPAVTLSHEHSQPGCPLQSYEDNMHCGIQEKILESRSTVPESCLLQCCSDDNELDRSASNGFLWFSLTYDDALEQLQVQLLKAENLPGRNGNSPGRDPFVKIFLMPDEETFQVSKVHKDTLNPVFNETHTFQVPADDVKKLALRISVYDIDRRRVRHCLGHVVVCLQDHNLSKNNNMQKKLEPMIQSAKSCGELRFGLTYSNDSARIRIDIHKAKNLNHLEEFSQMGVFVEVQLCYGYMCHRVKHTVVQQSGEEINFNESLVFTVNEKLLDTCNMRVSVMLNYSNADTTTEAEYGRVVIGPFMFAHGSGLDHWEEMLSEPGVTSTHWHILTNATPSS